MIYKYRPKHLDLPYVPYEEPGGILPDERAEELRQILSRQYGRDFSLGNSGGGGAASKGIPGDSGQLTVLYTIVHSDQMGARSQSDVQRLTERELAALRHVRNALHHGKNPTIREIQAALGYQSPNSAAYIVDKLIAAGYLQRREDDRLQLLRDLPEVQSHARTIEVPLVGTAPCGAPLLAQENVEAMVPVSTLLARPPYRYFLLRAQGDSMNLAGIHDGELVLVRQQETAQNGDRVVALIDDEATIKEFRRSKDAVALVPRSTKNTYKPIVLTSQFLVQGVVQATVPNLEGTDTYGTKERDRRPRRGRTPRTLDR